MFRDATSERKFYDVLFENDEVIVVDKFCGIEVCGADGVEGKLNRDYGRVFPVHRLDRNTRGLTIFAKTDEAKNCMEKAFREHRVEKKYTAILAGIPAKKVSCEKAFLFKDAKQSRVFISEKPSAGYRPIETEYRILKTQGDLCMAEIRLITGRTHQIRAHMAYLGCPVLGDGKYGKNAINRAYGQKVQQLCCSELQFSFEKTELLYTITDIVFRSRQILAFPKRIKTK